MIRFPILALILALLVVACGSDEPREVRSSSPPPAPKRDRTVLEILAEERQDKEVVALLPDADGGHLLADELGAAGVPTKKIRQPDYIRYQFYTNNLIQLIRRQPTDTMWVALDDSDAERVSYVDDFFFARHRVIARYEVDHYVLVHVANEMVGGSASGLSLEAMPFKVNGFVTGIEFAQDGARMFFCVKNGGISCYSMESGDSPQEFFRLPSLRKAKEGVYTGGESGLIGMALHPQFEVNGRMFVHYNWKRDDGSKSAIVEELAIVDEAGRLSVAGRRVLLEVDQPHDDHNSGALVFGPDGYLYIGVGDGLVGKWTIGRSPANSLRGKVLRIDVDNRSEGREYAIPADNPFDDGDGIPPETWAWGFRNPWRLSFLSDGRLVAGDIGEDQNEEVTLVERGRHHGWPYFEGAYVRNKWALDGVEPVHPLVAYGRTVGNSVVVGGEYKGEIGWLRGKLVFGDHLTGRLWAIDVPAERVEQAAPMKGDALLELGRWAKLITTFGHAPDGTLYVGAARGIYKLVTGAGATSTDRGFEPLEHEIARGMFEAEIAAPPAEGLGEAGVALGRLLFGSVALSERGDTACATCHPLGRYGQDGRVVGIAVKGKVQQRNTLPVFNAHRQFSQFADYRALSVEDATRDMLRTAHGLADDAAIAAAASDVPGAKQAFADVFGDEAPISASNVCRAIGAFLRQLGTTSRWEAYLDGDDEALSLEEREGLSLFVSIGCISCHQYRTLGGGMPQRLGLIKPWAGVDRGRADFTGVDTEAYYFKVPPLLNVEKTAPYYHDGSMKTLEEAVVHMASAQLARDLTPRQVELIVVFLGSLTGETKVPK